MAVKLQFDDSVDAVDGVCHNVSIGGMHVVADNPRPQGSLVRFELAIDEAISIRGLGEVVWMRSGSAGPGRDAGMGVKFRFLEQRDRQTIFKLVSEHIKKRLEQKHPGSETPEEDEAAPAAAAFRPPASAEPEAPPAPRTPVVAEPTPAFAPARAPAAEPALPSFDETPQPRDSEAPDFDLPTFREDTVPRERPAAGLPAEVKPKVDTGAYYRPRPAPRRDFPVLPLVALLLVAGGAGLYLGWDRIFGPSTPPPPVGPAPAPADDGADADAPGAADEERPVDEPPPLSVETAADLTPAPSPPPPAPPPAAAFTRVLDVSWTRRPGGIKVDVKTDGAIPIDRYDSFRLDGENPREVVRLRGVTQRYETREIPVSGAPVQRIRIGYHDNRELHIVLDMADRTSRISRMRAQGTTLEVFVE